LDDRSQFEIFGCATAAGVLPMSLLSLLTPSSNAAGQRRECRGVRQLAENVGDGAGHMK
jgi:hypothetical protein